MGNAGEARRVVYSYKTALRNPVQGVRGQRLLARSTCAGAGSFQGENLETGRQTPSGDGPKKPTMNSSTVRGPNGSVVNPEGLPENL